MIVQHFLVDHLFQRSVTFPNFFDARIAEALLKSLAYLRFLFNFDDFVKNIELNCDVNR